MATTPTSIRHPRLGKLLASKRSRTSTWISLVMVVLLILGTAYVVSTPATSVDRPASESLTQREMREKLVNEGLIPAKSLEPAPLSREELLRKLVNEGLIPAKSLEPAPQSREEIVHDLINRGLIPRQVLDE